MPVMAADMRLDFYHGFAGSVAPGKAHGTDMIRKKLEILETEINQFLPCVRKTLWLRARAFPPRGSVNNPGEAAISITTGGSMPAQNKQYPASSRFLISGFRYTCSPTDHELNIQPNPQSPK